MSIRNIFQAGETAKASDVNQNFKNILDLGKLFLYDKLGVVKWNVENTPTSYSDNTIIRYNSSNQHFYINCLSSYGSDGTNDWSNTSIDTSFTTYNKWVWYSDDSATIDTTFTKDLSGLVIKFKSVIYNWYDSHSFSFILTDGTNSETVYSNSNQLSSVTYWWGIDARDKSAVKVYQNGSLLNTYDLSSWTKINFTLHNYGNQQLSTTVYWIEEMVENPQNYSASWTYSNSDSYDYYMAIPTGEDLAVNIKSNTIYDNEQDITITLQATATPDLVSTQNYDIIDHAPYNLIRFKSNFGSD